MTMKPLGGGMPSCGRLSIGPTHGIGFRLQGSPAALESPTRSREETDDTNRSSVPLGIGFCLQGPPAAPEGQARRREETDHTNRSSVPLGIGFRLQGSPAALETPA